MRRQDRDDAAPQTQHLDYDNDDRNDDSDDYDDDDDDPTDRTTNLTTKIRQARRPSVTPATRRLAAATSYEGDVRGATWKAKVLFASDIVCQRANISRAMMC
jgi:hypothetical protein